MNNFQAFLDTNPNYYRPNAINKNTFNYTIKAYFCLVLGLSLLVSWSFYSNYHDAWWMDSLMFMLAMLLGGLFALKTWSEHAPIWEIVLSGFIFPLVFWLLYTPYIALKYYQYKTGKYPEKVASPA